MNVRTMADPLVGLDARVVERVVEPVRAERAAPLELGEVSQGLVRLDRQRQRGGVRRDDEIGRQTALEREIRHAERAVLIGVVPVANVVRRLGDSPRHAARAGRTRSAGVTAEWHV